MNLYDKYKKINKSNIVDSREINKNKVARDFESILETSANSYDVKYFVVEDIKRKYFEEDRVLIDDSAKVSETMAKDSKKLLCRASSNIGVGTYINWRDIDWLVVSEDMVTTSAYKKFNILPCHMYITKRLEDRIVDYPVAYENINSNAFNQEIGANSSKFIVDISMEKIIIPNMEEIREITKLNNRVMVNAEKVYKVKKEDTFQSKGIIYVSIQQDVLTEKDNLELNIADDIIEDKLITPPETVDSIIIKGDRQAKIGSSKEYEIVVNKVNDIYEGLKIEILPEQFDSLIENVEIVENKVYFKVIKNTKNINKKIKIKAMLKVKDFPTPLIYPELEPQYVDLEEEFEITIKGII